VTGFVAALDALYLLRDAAPSPELDPVAAVKLVELAGAEAIRVSGERAETDLDQLRRVARSLEVTIESSPAGLKTALEFRPDRVILTEEATSPVLRQLEEAGITVWARVAPSVEAVKAAHTAGVAGVEIDTSQAVDLPGRALASALEGVGDSSRLAAKLQMSVSLGGGLDTRTLRPFAERVPALSRVAVGRALLARALLVGLERAVKDLSARLP
jgi:pyridoxine 5-phosphate synthase